jgi:transcriptional regulator with XRE-family HTH domain
MPESFGARLRRQREEQNVALVTIAEQTKIKASLLEALERDDVSRWPSGIFRRAYVRAYAHAIGLSPDDVLREFLEKHPDPADNLDPVAAIAASDGSPGRSAPPTRFHYLVDSAMASLSRMRSDAAARAIAGNRPAAVPDGPTSRAADHPVREPACVTPEPGPVAEVNAPIVQAAVVDQGAMPRVEPNAGIDRVAYSSAADDMRRDASLEHPSCNESPGSDPDLVAFANVCAELARVENADQVQQLLQKAAGILEAAGLIVWVWDETAAELAPALVHGYSDKVVAQLPAVTEDADNVTAAAFRSAEARTVAGNEHANGALVVPLQTPAGCRGVLALELRPGRESANSVQALATIFAALLAQLIGDGRRADVPQPSTITGAPVGHDTRQVLRVNVRSNDHTRMRVRS